MMIALVVILDPRIRRMELELPDAVVSGEEEDGGVMEPGG